MKKHWRIFSLAILLLPVSGCFMMSEPFQEVARYDIAAPELIRKPCSVIEVQTFRSLAPAGRNFLYRFPDGRLREDPFMAWSQMPEMLLQRYLANTFSAAGGADAPAVQLGATLLEFGLLTQEKKAVLAVNYVIRQTGPEGETSAVFGYFRHQAELAGEGGPAASAAMSACFRALAVELAEKF